MNVAWYRQMYPISTGRQVDSVLQFKESKQQYLEKLLVKRTANPDLQTPTGHISWRERVKSNPLPPPPQL